MIRCPWCSSLNYRLDALLGTLGRRTHYRCRSCGGDFSKERE
jgi:transposase-like protein